MTWINEFCGKNISFTYFMVEHKKKVIIWVIKVPTENDMM